MTYEYKVFRIPSSSDTTYLEDVENFLNKLSENGYSILQVINDYYVIAYHER